MQPGAWAADPPPAAAAAPPGRILYLEESGGLITSVAPPTGKGSKATTSIPAAAPPPGKAAPAAGSTRVAAPKAVPAAAASPKKVVPAAVAAQKRAVPTAAAAQKRAVPAAAPTPPAVRSEPAPSPVDPQAKDREAYRALLERFATESGTTAERAASFSDAANAYIVQFRDADVATRLGWMWLEAKDPASAALWFGRARTWAPDSLEALRGLVVAAQEERDYARALALADQMPLGVPQREPMRQAALIALAERDYRAERFVDASGRLEEAARAGALPRQARALYGWSLLQLGNRRSAGETFAALYREAPDLEAAQGLMAAAKSGDAAIDPALAATEPLASLVGKERAGEAFARRRFLEARSLDAARYAEIGASGAPQAALAAQWREKTGDEGLSKLRARDLTLDAQASAAEAAVAGARWQASHLEAGTPAPGTIVGTGAEPQSGVPATRASLGEAAAWLRWEHGFALQALLGAGPFGGPLGARPLGTLSFNAASDRGELTLAADSRPVRESVLSLAGMRDPAGSGAWGGVSRTGVEARGLWLEHSPWSIGGRVAAARLRGTRVAGNTYAGAEVAAGYDLRLKGFSYAAISLGASLERYEKNLSHFTVGHGGYFSPQRYARVGAAFDFMTEENRPWMARGRASAARIDKREEAAPFFPLAPDGRAYAGSSGGGNDVSFQVAAARALGRYVQLGIAYARGVSPQYRESLALLQVRILFEPRRNVASVDLPVILR